MGATRFAVDDAVKSQQWIMKCEEQFTNGQSSPRVWDKLSKVCLTCQSRVVLCNIVIAGLN